METSNVAHLSAMYEYVAMLPTLLTQQLTFHPFQTFNATKRKIILFLFRETKDNVHVHVK
jgi:hypothetical protein